MRKVLGATRKQLVKQFWSEALVVSFLAFLVGMVLVELGLPFFKGLVNRDFSMDYRALCGILLGLIFIIGLFTGSYPALILSRFQPANVLKKGAKVKGAKQFSRCLVILQFSISIMLIVAALLMSQQMNYLKYKNLGFNKDLVIVIDSSELTKETCSLLQRVYRNLSSQYGDILKVAAGDASFGRGLFASIRYITEALTHTAAFYAIDEHYLDFFEMELVAFEGDTRQMLKDVKKPAIVNQALVHRLGWQNPIGKETRYGQTVVGVVKDFHLHSLHQKVEPVVLELNPDRHFSRTFVKVAAGKISVVLERLREKWHQVLPDKVFNYSFLDEDVAWQYRADEEWRKTVSYSAAFAIFISCLGTLGLASLAVVRRTKEIGIRKVLGASVPNIVSLLFKEFMFFIVVANIVAWPVAYYTMALWLQNFAYRINIDLWLFALGGILTLAIVLMMVASQAVKAALANPVDALRNE